MKDVIKWQAKIPITKTEPVKSYSIITFIEIRGVSFSSIEYADAIIL